MNKSILRDDFIHPAGPNYLSCETNPSITQKISFSLIKPVLYATNSFFKS